jgi:2-C-methyl-D-erythritol 4-phosphate cytidylyltransferase
LRGVLLLLAAGEGSRLDEGSPKAFADVCGTALVRRAADAACSADLVDSLVVAVPSGLEQHAESVLDGLNKPLVIVTGGETRQASALAASRRAPDAGAFAVHDAARAVCPTELFDACLRALDDVEAVCPAVAVSDTIKEIRDDDVVRTLDRAALVAVQTPQAFRADVYRRAHDAAARDGVVATDDAALVERLGVVVRVIPGDVRNVKITTKHDLAVVEALLRTGP